MHYSCTRMATVGFKGLSWSVFYRATDACLSVRLSETHQCCIGTVKWLSLKIIRCLEQPVIIFSERNAVANPDRVSLNVHGR